MADAIHLVKIDVLLNNGKILDQLEVTYNNRIQQMQQLVHQKQSIQREVRRQCYQQFSTLRNGADITLYLIDCIRSFLLLRMQQYIIYIQSLTRHPLPDIQ